jgi:cytidine deaminase
MTVSAQDNIGLELGQVIDRALYSFGHAKSFAKLKHPVGVAILTESGKIFGAHDEEDKYGDVQNPHAEEKAAFSAFSTKKLKNYSFKTIVIASQDGQRTLCADCLRFFNNVSSTMRVVRVDQNKTVVSDVALSALVR